MTQISAGPAVDAPRGVAACDGATLLPRSHDNLREVASPTGGVAEQGAGVGGDRQGSSCVEVHVFGGVIGVFACEGDHKVQFR